MKLSVNKDKKRITKLTPSQAKVTCALAENLYLNNIKINAKSNNKKTEMEFIGLDLLKTLVIIACFCIFAS